MTRIFMTASTSGISRAWEDVAWMRERIYESEMEELSKYSDEVIGKIAEILKTKMSRWSRRFAYRSRRARRAGSVVKVSVWATLLVAFVGFMGRHTLSYGLKEDLGSAVSWLLLTGVIAVLMMIACEWLMEWSRTQLMRSVAVQQILENEFDIDDEELKNVRDVAVLTMAASRFVFAGEWLAPYLDNEIVDDEQVLDVEGDESSEEDSGDSDGSTESSDEDSDSSADDAT